MAAAGGGADAEEFHNPDDADVRCQMVGDGAIGKTCLVLVARGHRFPDEYVPTCYDEHWFADVPAGVPVDHTANGPEAGEVDESGDSDDGILRLTMSLRDSHGGEDYDRLRPIFYPRQNVFLLCFSLINPASFENVSCKWWPEVHHHRGKEVPIILVGTKADLCFDEEILERLREKGQRPVSMEEGAALAKSIHANRYIEVSALTGLNVQRLVVETVRLGSGIAPHVRWGKEPQPPRASLTGRLASMFSWKKTQTGDPTHYGDPGAPVDPTGQFQAADDRTRELGFDPRWVLGLRDKDYSGASLGAGRTVKSAAKGG